MVEAGFSETIKLYNSDGSERMVTFRGEQAEDWGKIEKEIAAYLSEKAKIGWTMKRPCAVPPLPEQPTANGHSIQAGENTFLATTLTIEANPKNGERVGKLKGGKYTKHGVRLWPEAAAALGFDLAAMPFGESAITPVMVAFAVNEQGQPSKIIGRV